MEENNKKNGRKKFWRGFITGAIGAGVVVYEFCNGFREVKQVGNWFKDKFGSKNETGGSQNYQSYQNNSGNNWNNNKRRNN